MFPEGSDQGAILYLKGERVSQRRCLMTEASGISRRGVGVKGPS